MKLSSVIRTGQGRIIAFVGAGGKTTSMFRLARELADEGQRVITTTTTRIAYDELRFAPTSVQIQPEQETFGELQDLLTAKGHVFLYSAIDEAKGKVIGINPETVERAAHLGEADSVLVEADGARRLPLKAPYPHEPVIPASAATVVVVAGLDSLGLPLENTAVYGAELLRTLPASRLTDWVTVDILTEALTHRDFSLKGIPPQSEAIIFLNKVSYGNIEQAREVARTVLAERRISRVMLTAVQESTPVKEVYGRVAAIVLAAGLSSRMAQPKLLMPWKNKDTLIRHVCQIVIASGIRDLYVITGKWHSEIAAALNGLDTTIINNPAYIAGEMISSLQTGIRHLGLDYDACMVFLGDMPGVTPDIVNKLLKVYAQTQGAVVAPVFADQRGHPILFDRSLWQELLSLPPGSAPRQVISQHADKVEYVQVSNNAVLLDIDTPEDYRDLLNDSNQ